MDFQLIFLFSTSPSEVYVAANLSLFRFFRGNWVASLPALMLGFRFLCLSKSFMILALKVLLFQDFPGGSVAKTVLPMQKAWSWSGNYILHATTKFECCN